jgi:hypothetical protein
LITPGSELDCVQPQLRGTKSVIERRERAKGSAGHEASPKHSHAVARTTSTT